MLERMRAAHVADVARIHATSWGPHEISVKLGPAYQRMFYGSVVRSPYAFGYVYTDGGRVVGYATGFSQYEKFNNETKYRGLPRLLLVLGLAVLRRRLSLADLRNLLDDSRKLRKLRYPEHHLGALALAEEYKGTPIGREAITSTINAVVDEFRQLGFAGCWGVCDDRNAPMKRYLVRLGFAEVDQVEYPDKRVVVFEQAFASA